MVFNWTCPHCNRDQTVTEGRFASVTQPVGVKDVAEGSLVYETNVIGCANPKCKKLTFSIAIGQDDDRITQGWHLKYGTTLIRDTLLPRGSAKPQPDYIPPPLVEDYTESCLIKELSPKASATLSRRCLQGMIRDFCGISKKRLIDEINALKAAVEDGSADRSITPETVEAIDHLRSVGNIGAHMEADIDVIVPVDPGEAKAMIELIELLFEEWYGARERRSERLAKIAQIRFEKDEIKRVAKTEVPPRDAEVAADDSALTAE